MCTNHLEALLLLQRVHSLETSAAANKGIETGICPIQSLMLECL